MEKRFLIMGVFIVFTYLFAIVPVFAQEFNLSTKKLTLSMNVSSTIQSSATKIIANLTLFPRDDENQKVSLMTIPEAQIDGNSIIFNFNETGSLVFKVNSIVETEFFLKELKENLSLTGISIPSEFQDYTEESRFVVMDPYIRNKAKQLAVSDAVETLYNLAEYVRRNMNYSIQQQDMQNSSWIMQNKQGVCSHFTILFIALARSLGLPARFVSGVAYSGKDKMLREHAWAEVWLPGDGGDGWIPYDVTFGQYGWLDSSHVVMKKSLDVGSSVEYYYSGQIDVSALKIDTSIIETQEKTSLPIELEAFSYREKSDFNGYVPLEVTVENLGDYYVSVPVRVSVAPGVFGEQEKIVFLKPNSETRVFFIISIPDSENLEECGKECIATIAVEDAFGNKDETTILIGRDKPRMTLQEVQEVVRAYSKIYGKAESEIDFYCKADKEFYYEYENVSVICNARSSKETRVSVCNQKICQNLTLHKNQIEQIALEVPAVRGNDSLQMQCLVLCIITREYRDVLAVSCIDMKLLSSPQVNITSVQNIGARYGSTGPMNLIVESNMALNARLFIDNGKYQEQQIIFLKKGPNVLPVEMKTWKMNLGENPISLKLTYEDKNNKSYETSQELVFVVKDVNPVEKFFVKLWHLFG